MIELLISLYWVRLVPLDTVSVVVRGSLSGLAHQKQGHRLSIPRMAGSSFAYMICSK
ncbi:hypothetical protein [Archangium lipolyticum]|uniref:hypothetical protein n=1 Tax=Archangium lipolyticum TaxID=2970465 RepID=UPI00214A3E94|nr:hypothetical protein [Archangium lipolyticum]